MAEPPGERDLPHNPFSDDERSPLLGPQADEENPITLNTRGPSVFLPCDGFTWRSVALGSLIGSLVCLTNIHFGLQTGYINIMSMPSALIGFGVFELLKKDLVLPFSPPENVLIQTVASSVGAIPATAGLVGVIPALEFLVSPEDEKLSKVSLFRLCIWSLGISAFGLMFAVLLRERIIIKERLRFPTGTATALMINVLHSEKGRHGSDAGVSLQSATTEGENPASQYEAQERRAQPEIDHADSKRKPTGGLATIFAAMSASGVYTVITYFIPVLHNIPLFGTAASHDWLWSFNLSFGYLGQGIITGHLVLINMLAGTVVGWGILAPLAKAQGWAPGPVGDWDTGSRGWTIWICLAAMLADALVDLAGFVYKTLQSSFGEQQRPVTGSPSPDEQPAQIISSGKDFRFPRKWLAIGLLLSITAAIPAVMAPFGRFMPTWVTLFAIIITLPLCVMGIKAVGTTDHNPASGIAKICQLIVGYIVPITRPHAKLINLVAGGIAEAGAVQSGFMMQSFKTGYLSGSSPDTQFFGQLIGSLVGAILASALYNLYTSVYSIPNDMFQVPSAYVWRAGAALAVGEGLPEKAWIFGIIAAVLFGSFAAMRIAFGNKEWVKYIPMGIPFSVGMYNVPSFTLARALGGLVEWYCVSKMKSSQTSLMVFAAGLVLGEGLASIINLALEASRVPHL